MAPAASPDLSPVLPPRSRTAAAGQWPGRTEKGISLGPRAIRSTLWLGCVKLPNPAVEASGPIYQPSSPRSPHIDVVIAPITISPVHAASARPVEWAQDLKRTRAGRRDCPWLAVRLEFCGSGRSSRSGVQLSRQSIAFLMRGPKGDSLCPHWLVDSLYGAGKPGSLRAHRACALVPAVGGVPEVVHIQFGESRTACPSNQGR